MGYLIFYVSGLAFSLLLLAIGISFLSKFKSHKLQVVLSGLLFSLMFLPTILTSTAGYIFYTEKWKPSWFFPYTLSWLLLFCAGSFLILRRTGLDRIDRNIKSVELPKMKFAKWLLISLTISIATLWVMDRSVSKELESARSEASAVFDSLNYKPVAEKDNSSPILDKTFKLLNEEEFPEWFQKIEELGFDPASKEVREFIKEKGETLNLLRNETKKSYYPEIDFRKKTVTFFID